MLLSYAFSNTVLNADEITGNYTLAFQFLKEWMPKLNSTFEPLNDEEDKGDYDDPVSSNPELRRRRDSNPRGTINPCLVSSEVLSTTQPRLQYEQNTIYIGTFLMG